MANYIYGRNAIISSLENKKALKVFVKEGLSDQKLLSLIKSSGVPFEMTSSENLFKLVKTNKHQGIVALKEEFSYVDLDSLINKSKRNDRPFLLILDGVQDPHNFGAIIRTAAAFSLDGIIIKDRNQVQVTDVVEKVSVGAINHIDICKVNNLNNAVRKLKDSGYWIYASALRDSLDYSKLKYDRPMALIMGSEGEGISKLLLNNSDFIIRINMNENVESLNVSVATGILLAKMRE